MNSKGVSSAAAPMHMQTTAPCVAAVRHVLHTHTERNSCQRVVRSLPQQHVCSDFAITQGYQHGVLSSRTGLIGVHHHSTLATGHCGHRHDASRTAAANGKHAWLWAVPWTAALPVSAAWRTFAQNKAMWLLQGQPQQHQSFQCIMNLETDMLGQCLPTIRLHTQETAAELM